MDRVTLLMLGALTIAPCAWPVPGVVEPVDAAQDPLDRWQPFIAEAADRFDIPAAWLRAVMQEASGGRTPLDGRRNPSRTGPMGLMHVLQAQYEKVVAHARTRRAECSA